MVRGESFGAAKIQTIVEITNFANLDTKKHHHFGLAEVCPLEGCDGSMHDHIDDGEGGQKMVNVQPGDQAFKAYQ